MGSATIAGRVPPRTGVPTSRASTVLPLLTYVAGLVGVEVVAALGRPVLAVLASGALAVAVLNYAGVRVERATGGRDALGRALCALALLPLIGLVGTALAIDSVPATARVALVAVSSLAGAVVAARALGLTTEELGLKRGRVHAQVGIASTGIPLGLLALALGGGETFAPLREASPVALAAAIVLAAAVEELIFRGILASTFEELVMRSGILWTSALFAVTAIATGSVGLVITLALCGLVWGWARRRTGSIAGTAVAHALFAGLLAFVPPSVLG